MFFRGFTEEPVAATLDRADVGDLADYVQEVEWDRDAQVFALSQAQEVTHRDPEAATLLMAQLLAERKRDEESGGNSDSPLLYDPADIYSFMCREYAWRPKDIDSMHYRTFFAMVRKTKERMRRENAQAQQAYPG